MSCAATSASSSLRKKVCRMLLSVKATATYELSAETFLLVMVEPHAEAPDHLVKDARFVTSPTTFSVSGNDPQGNIQRRIVGRPAYSVTNTQRRSKPSRTKPSRPRPSRTRRRTCPRRRWPTHCRRATASRTCSRGWPATSSGRYPPAAGASARSESGSGRTSSTATGRPARRRRPSTRRPSVSASAATSPIWSSRSAGPWACRPATSRPTPGAGAPRLPRDRAGRTWADAGTTSTRLRGRAPGPCADRRRA